MKKITLIILALLYLMGMLLQKNTTWKAHYSRKQFYLDSLLLIMEWVFVMVVIKWYYHSW